jgi:hypothetical protein
LELEMTVLPSVSRWKQSFYIATPLPSKEVNFSLIYAQDLSDYF